MAMSECDNNNDNSNENNSNNNNNNDSAAPSGSHDDSVFEAAFVTVCDSTCKFGS